MTKTLEDMSLEELWQLFPIVLTSHQDCWKDWYSEEAAALKQLLPAGTKVHHIGSTAVPGIRTKPIVDILACLPMAAEFPACRRVLEKTGWICMSQSDSRMSFNKGYTDTGFADRVFHLHLRLPGDEDELYFRDWLTAHPEDAALYEALKLDLWRKHEHDRDGYTAAKTGFVERITKLARERAGLSARDLP